MASTSKKRSVSFLENVTVEVQRQYSSEDSESEGGFREITSSEAETVNNTSDEEDAERLEIALQLSYCCDPSLLKSSAAFDPAERNSLLFLDKDLCYDAEERKSNSKA